MFGTYVWFEIFINRMQIYVHVHWVQRDRVGKYSDSQNLKLVEISFKPQLQHDNNSRLYNTFDKISICENDIISNLTNVYDPEIPVNIYDLGLIYDINISKGNNVFIKMSLTSPGCPVAGELPKQVADELTKIKNIGLIEVELVWDPPWTKERMSEDAKLALDI